MSNLDQIIDLARGVSDDRLTPAVDFLKALAARESKRKQEAFEEWKRTCPVDDEEDLTPKELAAIQADIENYRKNGGTSLDEILKHDEA